MRCSAVPGWPADVPLPVDVQWKNSYAASVQRLIRDGVDRPLATLFVHATCNVTPYSEGVERARSASEAFLYRRLETLPETAGESAYDALPLREAVGRLPEALRQVVILRYFGGYTLWETAQSLGVPQGTVATRQRRALTLLRLELGEEDAHEPS